MYPFRKEFFELVSVLQGIWKFLWTLFDPFCKASEIYTICSRNNVFVFLKDIYLFLRYVCTSEYKKMRHCRDICHAQVVN